MELLHICWINVYRLDQGFPNPRATDRYWSTAYWELGRTAGGEQRASEQSFICCSPSLALPPEPLFALPPEPSPPPVRGKNVFHEAGPWCQKRRGPLI